LLLISSKISFIHFLSSSKLTSSLNSCSFLHLKILLKTPFLKSGSTLDSIASSPQKGHFLKIPDMIGFLFPESITKKSWYVANLTPYNRLLIKLGLLHSSYFSHSFDFFNIINMKLCIFLYKPDEFLFFFIKIISY